MPPPKSDPDNSTSIQMWVQRISKKEWLLAVPSATPLPLIPCYLNWAGHSNWISLISRQFYCISINLSLAVIVQNSLILFTSKIL